MPKKIPYEKLKAYGHDETTVNRAVGQLVYDGVMDPSEDQILSQIIRMRRAESGERISEVETKREAGPSLRIKEQAGRGEAPKQKHHRTDRGSG